MNKLLGLYINRGQQRAVEQLYAVLESSQTGSLSPVTDYSDVSGDIYKQLGFPTDFNEKTQISVAAPYSIHATWGILSVGREAGLN